MHNSCQHRFSSRPSAAAAYRAVADGDGACELNEITSSNRGELREEGDQVVDAVGDTEVREERRLDRREDEHRAVGSATTVGRAKSAQANIGESFHVR